jgi:hypothetical protein
MYDDDPRDDQDLNDPPELPLSLAEDEDIEWALLAEAVERGDWPETEVAL